MNRTPDELLAIVAHELRAPLATMLIWERVLRDATSDDKARLDALDAIHESALQQARLVADLLDAARATTGKLAIDLRAVDLDHVVEEAVALVRPMFVAKQVELVTDLVRIADDIDGDALRLRQVLDILVSNALKFTDRGGRVSVATRRAETSVVMEVRDTGCGIEREFLPRLFEPFSQSGDPLEGGLGLGLAIAHELVALHDGELAATSEGPGRGATFTITLPARRRRIT